MKLSNSSQLKIGSLLSYVQMFLGIVISILYTPIMLNLLGQSEYGLYNTVSSTISMLSLLSLGFNSGYIRYFSKYKNTNDTESISKLNGLFLIIFTIIGIIALICGIFLSFNLNLVFSSGLNHDEYQTAKVLMILLTINLSISFPMSVFGNIISANEKFVFLKIIKILTTVVSPLITLPLLLMGYKSVAMVVISLLVSLFADCLYFYYVVYRLNNKFIFRDLDKQVFRSLFSYTFFIAINMIVDQINWNVDKILLGRFKGTEVVAVYSIGYTIYQFYMMFSTSISSVFTPRIHRIIQDTDDNLFSRKNQITILFVKVGRIQFILLGLISTGFYFFGKAFVTIYWSGINYTDSYFVALLLIFSASIALIQNIGIEIQRALNLHKFRAIVYLVMAIINVIISINLCQKYGAIGSALGTAISLILANGIIMNIYYHLYCNIDVIKFWSSILQLSKGLVIPIIFEIFFSMFLRQDKVLSYLLGIVLYSIIYVISMWFVGMNHYEKSLVANVIKKVMKK